MCNDDDGCLFKSSDTLRTRTRLCNMNVNSISCYTNKLSPIFNVILKSSAWRKYSFCILNFSWRGSNPRPHSFKVGTPPQDNHTLYTKSVYVIAILLVDVWYSVLEIRTIFESSYFFLSNSKVWVTYFVNHVTHLS